MRQLTLVLLVCAATATAQTTPAANPKAAAGEAPTLKPLPKGETRVFEAIVMNVVGVAQARAEGATKWQQLKVNDVLKPGVLVRTGRKSLVALRVGPNATLVIDRQTRVAIPQIIQDGDTLRTRVGVEFGRIDAKASRIGLATDFTVSTPSSTLAVRGTTLRISWDAVHGSRAEGVPSNGLRAIEMEYARKVAVALTKADESSDDFPLPAIHAFWVTYIVPLQGALTPEILEDPRIQPTDLSRAAVDSSGLAAARQRRGNKLDGLTGQPPPSTDSPPPTTGGQ